MQYEVKVNEDGFLAIVIDGGKFVLNIHDLGETYDVDVIQQEEPPKPFKVLTFEGNGRQTYELPEGVSLAAVVWNK